MVMQQLPWKAHPANWLSRLQRLQGKGIWRRTTLVIMQLGQHTLHGPVIIALWTIALCLGHLVQGLPWRLQEAAQQARVASDPS